MSGISEKQLDDWESGIKSDPVNIRSWQNCLVLECIAEIRRLRAENERQKELLQSVVTFADEAWAKWDADEDMRVGKMLVALAGGCPGYRPETDAIHAALKS